MTKIGFRSVETRVLHFIYWDDVKGEVIPIFPFPPCRAGVSKSIFQDNFLNSF